MSDDKKALQILFDRHWSPGGWTRNEEVDRADFEYARQAGYMFDPVSLTHDDIVARLVSVRARIDLERVADAFLASLSTRRLAWRSALGSFACAARFPVHGLLEQTARRVPSGRLHCCICGCYGGAEAEPQDLNILSFERWKWGGIRHADPLYGWFDLTRFETMDHVAPTHADHAILAEIIGIASGMAPDARPGDLDKRISKAIKSNSAERRTLVQILGYCGILKPAGCDGFLQVYTADELRDRPPDRANDWAYPVIWWRGADGVDRDVLHRLFPKVAATV